MALDKTPESKGDGKMICEVPFLAKILQMPQKSSNPRTRRNEKRGNVGRGDIPDRESQPKTTGGLATLKMGSSAIGIFNLYHCLLVAINLVTTVLSNGMYSPSFL